MRPKDLEKVIKEVCGEERGAAAAFAKVLGTTPATVSRWRDGKIEIKPRDEKLINFVYREHQQLGKLL